MSYQGVIIEESLQDKTVLADVQIISTKVEPVTKRHKTPWLQQWTLHTVEIADDAAASVAERLSKSLDNNYWYADFRNERTHYIIFPGRVFAVDRSNPAAYEQVVQHGLSLRIPSYQLDFSGVFDEKNQPQKT